MAKVYTLEGSNLWGSGWKVLAADSNKQRALTRLDTRLKFATPVSSFRLMEWNGEESKCIAGEGAEK